MKDKTARALAITALIFMGIFVISFPMAFMGTDFVYGTFLYLTVGSGALTLLIFLLLKIDGRGFSMTKINNEIQMKKIEEENDALIAAEKAEKSAEVEADETPDKTETDK